MENRMHNAEIPFQMNICRYAENIAKALEHASHGDTRSSFATFGKESADFLLKLGNRPEDIADAMSTLMESEIRIEEQERKKSIFQHTRPYSMVATQKKSSEIREFISLMNNYLMCIEIIFCDLEQKYVYYILDMLKEKGLYRHQFKKHVNRLREITGTLQMRIRDNDKAATLRSSSLVMSSCRYADNMFEENAGIGFKLQDAFLRMFDMKLKLIRMDNRETAKKMGVNHPDLMSEIFTLLAISETAIELFSFCQKQIRIAGRGRIIDHSIKSTHHESVRNAVRGLIDQFVRRGTVIPQEEAMRSRKHVGEFQQELTGDSVFEMFNSQYMALRIGYIEFYLASVRLQMERGTIGRAVIREVWRRLGTRKATLSFFKQLAKIPIPEDKDTNTADVARAISEYGGKVKTVDDFRRFCAEGTFAEPPKESEEQFRCRVLRTVARKFGGQIPDDVLSSIVRIHGTKKAVVEQLEKAGFELAPTLRRVKRMKASELKNL